MKSRAVICAELRAAADRLRAAGGRGARTAIALAEALVRADASDLRGTAPDLAARLGLSVCDRAAREGLRRLAAEVPFITASGRHQHGAVALGGA